MDGGLRSTTNSDVAVGHHRVLIFAPMPSGPDFDIELAKLATSKVHVVRADENSLRAFGLNPLDPATREPSARAGKRQGEEISVQIKEFWSGK